MTKKPRKRTARKTKPSIKVKGFTCENNRTYQVPEGNMGAEPPVDSSPQDIKEAMEKVGVEREKIAILWPWPFLWGCMVGVLMTYGLIALVDHQSPLPTSHAHIVNAPPKSKIDDTGAIKSAARFVYTAHYVPDMVYSNGKFHAVNVDPKLVETLPFFYTADNGKCVKSIPVPGDPGVAWHEKCLCSDFNMIWNRDTQQCE